MVFGILTGELWQAELELFAGLLPRLSLLEAPALLLHQMCTGVPAAPLH